jgi:hypothetical protein
MQAGAAGRGLRFPIESMMKSTTARARGDFAVIFPADIFRADHNGD